MTDKIIKRSPAIQFNFAGSRRAPGIVKVQRDSLGYGIGSNSETVAFEKNTPVIAYDLFQYNCEGLVIDPTCSNVFINNTDPSKPTFAEADNGTISVFDYGYERQFADFLPSADVTEHGVRFTVPEDIPKNTPFSFSCLVRRFRHYVHQLYFTFPSEDGTRTHTASIFFDLSNGEFIEQPDPAHLKGVQWYVTKGENHIAKIQAYFPGIGDICKANSGIVTCRIVHADTVAEAAAAIKTGNGNKYEGTNSYRLQIGAHQFSIGAELGRQIIPTVDGKVSRSSDTVTVPAQFLNDLIVSNDVTIIVEADFDISPGSKINTLFQYGDASTGYYALEMSTRGIRGSCQNDNKQGDIFYTDRPVARSGKFGMTVTPDTTPGMHSVMLSHNGSDPSIHEVQTSTITPSPVADLSIGNYHGVDTWTLRGVVKRLTIYSPALNVSELPLATSV